MVNQQVRNPGHEEQHAGEHGLSAACLDVRAGFPDYLDGTASGVEMAAIAGHLDSCIPCAREFDGLCTVQQALATLGPAKAPEQLQQDLHRTLRLERDRGTHLPLAQRAARWWHAQLAPLAIRFAGGLSATVLLLSGAISILGLSNAVFASDDNMAHLVQPRYLYSQVLPMPVETRHDVPVIVEAKVDARGRVYDYSIIAGPTDAQTQVQVERNLLSSVFQPATLFGVPVRGHVVVTYAGVSVRG